MSRGQAQPRYQSVRRVLERCKTRDTIEIIDVDKEPVDVVIVDAEETSHQESSGPGTRRRKCFPGGVICIDDDDGGADDTFKNVHADDTSKECHPASSDSSKSEKSKGDECLMTGRKENLPFESMEYTRNRKYDDVGPSVNRFGLGCSSSSWSDNDRSEFVAESSISESVGCDSDSSDCEIMEDSGNIREQWEKAALRKRVSHRHQFGSKDQISASGPSADARFSSGEESCSKIDIQNCLKKNYSNQSKESPSECCPNNLSSGKENLSFNISTTAELGESFCKTNVHTAGLNVDPTTNTCHKEPEHVSETCAYRAHSTCKHHSDNLRSEFRDPETVLFTSVCHLNMQHDPKAEDNGVSSPNEDEQVPTATTSCANGYHAESSIWEKMGPHTGKSSPCNPQAHDGEQLTPDSTIKDKDEHHHEEPSCSMHPQCGFVACETAGCREKENFFDEQSLFNYHCSVSPLLNSDSEPISKESLVCNTAGGNETPGRSVSFDTGSEDKPQEQCGLILERERHKASDEYKLAVEEEWAARQHQLRIQAEEVQKLKRRRKAETLRLLDMERRQKQRLEEIRESQKKVEEAINLKENLRAEVRKELEKMELRYRDMASLLRGLGIPVKGGPFPLPSEVNAAYKQALLRFHPDRTSRSDIHQQVRAEETFKLISRLKEKLRL